MEAIATEAIATKGIISDILQRIECLNQERAVAELPPEDFDIVLGDISQIIDLLLNLETKLYAKKKSVPLQ